MIELFESYLTSEKRYSGHTVTAYLKDVDSLLVFNAIEDLNELHELTHHSIRGWMISLIEGGLDNRSVNRKLSSLRTFFKWAKRSGLIEADPMLRVKGPKQQKRLPEFVKEEELTDQITEELFTNDFQGIRDQVILELFYQTGIRLSELIGLKENDVFDQSIKVLGKRNKERIIPISNQLDELIKNYIKIKHELTFDISSLIVTDKGNRLYPKFAYRKINYYLSLITKLGKRSPHVLRHTFATHMLNNGAGLESLKEILGHANLSATQVYTHNSFDKLTSIYKQAHPRGFKNE
jgi:integrase/recombinase XerC